MADIQREDDGRFANGHVKRGGRQKGTLNKVSQFREMAFDVFNENDGREVLVKLLKDEPKAYVVNLLAGLMPKLKVEENKSLSLDVNLAEIPTSQLMQALGLSGVGEAEEIDGLDKA